MSRTWAVIKREFNASVRTKMFVIGTIFGPLLMIGFAVLPAVLAESGGGVANIAIVDATDVGVGDVIAGALPAPVPEAERVEDFWYYRTEVVVLGDRAADALRAELATRIEDGELDGYLWLPAGLAAGEAALYEGKHATNLIQMEMLESSIERVVREDRLRRMGIDPARVAVALRPVAFDARKFGDNAATGGAEAMLALSYILGFVLYMAVAIYGQAVMRGVLEEKRDRIVEITMSSIRAEQLLLGKVLGIGGAGLLQLLVWVGFAAAILVRGEELAARFGFTLPELPQVPLRVGVVLLVFFTGGYLLYSVIYAVVGAIVTSDQEAQQLAFPAMMPLIAAFLLMFPAMTNPDGTTTTVASLVPFTSPIIMPIRATLTEVPTLEIVAAAALVAVTVWGMIWIAAKIYRIGMLATGKKPSFGELVRWVREA